MNLRLFEFDIHKRKNRFGITFHTIDLQPNVRNVSKKVVKKRQYNIILCVNISPKKNSEMGEIITVLIMNDIRMSVQPSHHLPVRAKSASHPSN
jgi:hypothetical protein